MDYKKYKTPYFLPPEMTYDWVKKHRIDKPPIWCSVDLRDGNQALIEPMSLDEKLTFFKLLVQVGFKEIEVGFPAASETEYTFLRTLIEQELIPDDVTVQVLTQAREHIIKKTFEAVKGAKRAVVHLYNSTSVAQREQVFRKSKQEIKELARDGAILLKELAAETEGDFLFQYSPESFSGTEVEYAVEVSNAVLDVWEPTKDRKAILNIPTTVENAMPHVFASQIEYIDRHITHRDGTILCIHPHNDRGCAVATSELAVLAGAERIEGTLFGNGERTGNVDIVSLAMNMFSHGTDPGLDFSDMPHIVDVYESCTGMKVSPRQPYAGELVFTAFSGSHQDAIAKGMKYREEGNTEYWDVPYLPIDPKDVGRTYDSDVIRINSQSGKGGVAYILKQNFGLSIPDEMREQVSYATKHVSDVEHKELSPEWVYDIFKTNYITNDGPFKISECHFTQTDGIISDVTLDIKGKSVNVKGTGNGRLDSVSNALKQYFGITYELSKYEEHALTRGSSSKAVAYVGITYGEKMYWGVGMDADIIKASISALNVAVGKILPMESDARDERLNDIMNYIHTHYTTVTLEELAEHFGLSTQYISKYIKDKSGMNFGDIVQNVRLKKACSLLKNENMKVETIAMKVGYPTTEHFNRLFKRKYNMTPLQYRNAGADKRK